MILTSVGVNFALINNASADCRPCGDPLTNEWNDGKVQRYLHTNLFRFLILLGFQNSGFTGVPRIKYL